MQAYKSKDTQYQTRSGGGIAYSLLTSALEGGGWSAPRPGRFIPGKVPVPIVQEAGWTPGPVWTCAKNLAPTWIRSPEHLARIQSYRLSYRRPYAGLWHRKNFYLSGSGSYKNIDVTNEILWVTDRFEYEMYFMKNSNSWKLCLIFSIWRVTTTFSCNL
jgi:hypothetical protein